MKTLVILTAALLALCGCATQPPHGVPNLAQVAPGIYRGGQPTAEGWRYLQSLGVNNVVKLNTVAEGSDAPAQRLGMRVVACPINLLEQTLGEPNSNQLWLAVGNVRLGTYIHCAHGQDRTGLVVAMYRVRCGWSKPAAEAEMLAHGFHPWLRGLYWAWEDFIQ